MDESVELTETTDAPPPESNPKEKIKKKAGRNLPAAIGVGVVLGGGAVASLFLYRPAFIGLVIVMVSIGTWELWRSCKRAGRTITVIPNIIGGAGIMISAYSLGLEAMLAATFVTAGAVLLWRESEGDPDTALHDINVSVFALAYLPMLASFVMLMLAEVGEMAVLAFVLATIFSDTGGYAAGVLFGKHPMAPKISPKKSWEGFLGSLIGSSLAAIAVILLWGQVPWWVGFILGPLVAVMATIGDLSESLLKRDLGIKDMGSILPGHGGILDRVDSLIVVAPVAYLVLRTAVLL